MPGGLTKLSVSVHWDNMSSSLSITLNNCISLCNPCVVLDATFTGFCFVGERRKLDIEYFSKLLEKILEVQRNRKKLKSLAEKNSPRKQKRKAKGNVSF